MVDFFACFFKKSTHLICISFMGDNVLISFKIIIMIQCKTNHMFSSI